MSWTRMTGTQLTSSLLSGKNESFRCSFVARSYRDRSRSEYRRPMGSVQGELHQFQPGLTANQFLALTR